MSNRFLHIGFNFASGKVSATELTPAFNKAIDWYRYAPNSWVVWTSSAPEKWYDRLKPQLPDEDTFFIVEINAEERHGWMNEDFWTWLSKERNRG